MTPGECKEISFALLILNPQLSMHEHFNFDKFYFDLMHFDFSVSFQSSVLELADIFGPGTVTSTHTSADPWDIPGGSNSRSVEVWNHDTAFSPPGLSLSSSWQHNSKKLCSFPPSSFLLSSAVLLLEQKQT